MVSQAELLSLKESKFPNSLNMFKPQSESYLTRRSQMGGLERKKWLDSGGWVLYWFRVLRNKFSDVTNHKCIISHCHRSPSRWVSGPEPPQAEIKVSAMRQAHLRLRILFCALVVGRLGSLRSWKEVLFSVGCPPGVPRSSSAASHRALSRHGGFFEASKGLCFF